MIKFITYMIKAYKKDKITVFSAHASFFIVISAVPFSALLIYLFSFLSTDLERYFEKFILAVIPSGLYSSLSPIVEQIRSVNPLHILPVGIATAIWTSCKGVDGLCKGIEYVWYNYDASPFIFRFFRTLLRTVIFTVLILLSLFVFSLGNIMSAYVIEHGLNINVFYGFLIRARTLLFFFLLFFIFSYLFARLSGKEKRVRKHIPGALFSSAGWIVFTYFYSIYISFSLDRTNIYAGFGSVAFFMLWIYFCVVIVLLGSQINKYIYMVDFAKKKEYNGSEVNSLKRLVTIQDLSCFGKCSITVALPLISSMGIECSVIPTSVLSTHTGGFEGYTIRDISDDIPLISEHWKKYNISFNTIYTGYLANKKQTEYTLDFIKNFKKEDTLLIVDPAMADNGVLYRGFDDSFPSYMAKLCSVADVITPNITEACLLTNTEYKVDYDENYVKNLAVSLSESGAKKIVITGVSYDSSTQGAVFFDGETNEYLSYFRENEPMIFHGTGDTFASVLAGSLTLGIEIKNALNIAVDFTVDCIKQTIPDAKNHKYATNFEECIPNLLEYIEKNKRQ